MLKELLKALRKGWICLFFTLCALPSLAFAATNVHASGYLGAIIGIAIVLLIVIVILWALGYWASEIPAILVKVVKFAVIFIALIIIIIILLGLAGIHIT